MSRQTTEERLKAEVSRLPTDPGVYLFKDARGQIIYVGKAKELRTRVRNYFREGGDGRSHVPFLVQRIESIDFMVTATEQEALILENNLIKKHRPRYNIFLRDDKTYVHVRLNVDHPFPRLTVVRTPKRDKARYFGPYASAGSVRSTLRTLGKIFPMRTCSDQELTSRKRPCLYYYIKRCPAPCVGYVDAQAYNETVQRVTMFMKGRGEELVKKLSDKMDLQAAERRYEEAARTRDQLYAVKHTLERQDMSSPKAAQHDVFGVYRENERMVVQILYVRAGKMIGGDVQHFDNATMSTGEHLASFINQFYQRGAIVPPTILVSEDIGETDALESYLSGRREGKVTIKRPQRGELKRLVVMATHNARLAFQDHGAASRHKELLEELQDLLELERLPRRIECFDISNLQGRDAVASQSTFIDGEPARALYRHYRVRTVEGADDYGMMREILERRLSRGLEHGDLPDTLLVDGGQGQLNVALDVAQRLGVEGVDILGIAKVREGPNNRKVRGKERIYSPRLPEPLLLEGNSEALYLLERVRDEAHRFAVTYHKKLRSKRFESSALDAVPGVGPVLKLRLLAAFGSVEGIRRAGAAELTAVQGVSGALAARLKETLDVRG